MSILGRLLRRKSEIDLMTQSEKAAVVESLIADTEALAAANVDYARQLATQIGGNHKLVMNERPDGSGFFYGNFHDEGGTTYRVDVMPPKDIWSGDFGNEAAHDTQWVVYLNGEEVQRAESIDGLAVLAVGDA